MIRNSKATCCKRLNLLHEVHDLSGHNIIALANGSDEVIQIIKSQRKVNDVTCFYYFIAVLTILFNPEDIYDVPIATMKFS